MPTILRIGTLRVVIYHCPHGPPALRESFGFKRPDLSAIKNALAGAITLLCAKWSAIHGSY